MIVMSSLDDAATHDVVTLIDDISCDAWFIIAHNAKFHRRSWCDIPWNGCIMLTPDGLLFCPTSNGGVQATAQVVTPVPDFIYEVCTSREKSSGPLPIGIWSGRGSDTTTAPSVLTSDGCTNSIFFSSNTTTVLYREVESIKMYISILYISRVGGKHTNKV